MVRCGSVPLGAANCTMPSANAAIAAKAWSGIAGAAASNGARLTGQDSWGETHGVKLVESPRAAWSKFSIIRSAPCESPHVNFIHFNVNTIHINEQQGVPGPV